MNSQRKLRRLTSAVRSCLPALSSAADAASQRLYEILATALDEIGDEFDGTITFATTLNVYESLKPLVAECDQVLQETFARSRITKRRVFISLPADHKSLRRFREILMDARHSSNHGLVKAYSRLVKQIDKEVLSVSPLTILARAGL